MDFSFLSYAVLVEIIILLVGWIVFIHWRLSKSKKALAQTAEIEPPDPFEVYLQFLNRELTETRSHLDVLNETTPDDQETLLMYQYRLRHLEAEYKAMKESSGEVIRFWEIYHANIDFIYSDENEESENENDAVDEQQSELEAQPESGFLLDELEAYQKSSTSVIEQSDNIIELVQKAAAQNGSEELNHLVELLQSEQGRLVHELHQMETEYNRLMSNANVQLEVASRRSGISIDDIAQRDEIQMSKVLNKQNSRISELNDLVGNLSLELEDKKRLVEEMEWVARQLKETEQVVIILEDENSFLREQVKVLLD